MKIPRAKASISPDTNGTSTINLLGNPSEMVIVHCIERGKTVPHPSPFVLKLETYLRMANISYQIDTQRPYAAVTKKMPWVTVNDQVLTDSQLIIDFLNKNFEKDLWGNTTLEQQSIARSIRRTLEEHFYWALMSWRFIQGVDTLGELLVVPSIKLALGKIILPQKFKKILYAQGLGRLPQEALERHACEDLRNVSQLLGNKKFFFGDEPTEIDATLFGFLSQVIWGSTGSPYEALVYSELLNLKFYCVRMKDLYWPDWDTLLAKD